MYRLRKGGKATISHDWARFSLLSEKIGSERLVGQSVFDASLIEKQRKLFKSTTVVAFHRFAG